jgi:uncharacterized protein
MLRRLLLGACLALAGAASATTAPGGIAAAVFTDPPPDAKFPASMEVLHIPTGGVAVNGLAYIPTGPGPHPTLLLCHGLPGNEKNLDIAQAARRAGWVAVTFNYRGSWGSPGTFSFTGNIQDAKAVLAYLREPAHAQALRIDPRRIVILGHSMGGLVAAKVGASDANLLGTVLISAWDPARETTHDARLKEMADDMETLAGVTAESMTADVEAHASELSLLSSAPGLAHHPLLVLSSDDGLAPGTDALVAEVRRSGGGEVTTRHAHTDHAWSDHRIELQTLILNWLQSR